MDIGSRLVSHCHSLRIPEPRPTKNLCVGNSGGGAHGRISDDRYRASFSDSHRFHVSEGDFHNRRFRYAAIRSGSLTRGHKVGSTRMMFTLSTPMVGITCSTPSIPGFASRSTSFNHFSSADSGEIAGCSSLKCEAHPAKVLTVVRQLFPIEQSSSSRICNIGWIGRVTNVTAVGKIKKYKRSSWQMGCWTDQISL
jgi:hypothetical protein